MVRRHRCLDTMQLLELAEGRVAPGDVLPLLLETEGCPDCMALLGEAGLAVAQEAKDSDAGKPSELFDSGALLGTIVAGRYRIDRWLGRGGMGEVYEARDLELDERVALKTILPRLAQDHVALRRFRREVRLARQIVHPNVCRVLELGRDGEGDAARYFLTMELLEGETLNEKIRREGALAPDTALEIGIGICAGLSAIHRAGVLHRDVKPSNVMIRSMSGDERPGDRVVASLLDFGVARAFAGPITEGDAGARTRGAALPRPARAATSLAGVGTPDYMAPEQLSGGSLGAATDLYALGVVLLEMLTGVRPSHLRRGSVSVAPSSPPFASALDGDRGGALAHALGGVVSSCLDPDPSNRPGSAEELREALVRLRCRDSGSRPDPAPLRSERPPFIATPRSRHEGSARLAALGGVALVVAAFLLAGSESKGPGSTPGTFAESVADGSSVLAADVPSPTVQSDIAAEEAASEVIVSQPKDAHGTSIDTERPSAPGTARDGVSEAPAKPFGAKTSLDVGNPCSPPFYYDGEGIKTFRKECL